MATTQSKTTTDHDEIRQWAEAHEGKPAAVIGTGEGSDPGILRIDFPGFSGEGKLRPIAWDEFFKWFDANELALVYRPKDRFNKLISRTTAQAGRRGKARAPRKTTAATSPRKRTVATKKRVQTARGRAAGRTSGRSARARSASKSRSASK
jgi:hypothetical protein